MSDEIITIQDFPKLFSKQRCETLLDSWVSGGGGVMDGCLHICKENNIDPSDIGKFIPKKYKELLRAEGERLHMLTKDD